jgi:hypothetical protein
VTVDIGAHGHIVPARAIPAANNATATDELDEGWSPDTSGDSCLRCTAANMHNTWHESRRSEGFIEPVIVELDEGHAYDVANGGYPEIHPVVRLTLAERMIDNPALRLSRTEA